MSGNKRKGGPRPGMTDEERAEEIVTMLRMRRAGADYASIAKHFHVSRETVHRKVKQALQELPREEASELRSLEAAKLDYAETRLQNAVNDGDVQAINALVRLSESRRKLLGLDMPEQHEVKVSTTEQTLMKQAVAALQEQAERRAKEGLPRGADRV